MPRWFKKVMIFMGGLFAVALVLFGLSSGRSHIKKADKAEAKAKALRDKADLIDKEIEALQKRRGEISKATAAKIERIKKLETAEEISDAFNKL